MTEKTMQTITQRQKASNQRKDCQKVDFNQRITVLEDKTYSGLGGTKPVQWHV